MSYRDRQRRRERRRTIRRTVVGVLLVLALAAFTGWRLLQLHPEWHAPLRTAIGRTLVAIVALWLLRRCWRGWRRRRRADLQLWRQARDYARDNDLVEPTRPDAIPPAAKAWAARPGVRTWWLALPFVAVRLGWTPWPVVNLTMLAVLAVGSAAWFRTVARPQWRWAGAGLAAAWAVVLARPVPDRLILSVALIAICVAVRYRARHFTQPAPDPDLTPEIPETPAEKWIHHFSAPGRALPGSFMYDVTPIIRVADPEPQLAAQPVDQEVQPA